MADANSVEKTRETPREKMNGSKSLAGATLPELTERMNELTHRAREMTQQAADQSVSMVKRYPFHTALGAAVIGFIAGVMIRRK